MNARAIIEAESPKKALRVLSGRPGGAVYKIEIWGRRWFQRTYGNTYHSARVYVNDKLVHTIPFAYGYGSQYEQSAWDWLAANGYVNPTKHANGGYEPPWAYCRDKGIEYSAHAEDVRSKGQLAF
jgi:hypothetical protein